MVVLGGAAALQGVGAQETDDAGNQPQVTEPDVGDSFEVESLAAPESVGPNDNVTVVAEVSNPSNDRATQAVEYRVEGQVVDRAMVTVEGGATETVRLSTNTSDLGVGTVVHGVFTQGDGEIAEISIMSTFTVDSLSAPENVTEGEDATVEATITNPNNDVDTQDVVLRVDGQAVLQQSVELGAGESTTVTFDVSADDFETDAGSDVFVSVFTRDDGQMTPVSLVAAEEETEDDGPVVNIGDNETEDNDMDLDDNESDVEDNETEDELEDNESENMLDGNESDVEDNETEDELADNESGGEVADNESEPADNESDTADNETDE